MDTTFADLAAKCSVRGLRDVYELIHDRVKNRGTQDAATPVSHPIDEINFIRGLLYDEVKAAYARDGIPYQSVSECRAEVRQQVLRSIVRFTRDGFYNPQSGAGMRGDPGLFNLAYTPVSMSPEEATALYSSGGIARVITDKKARGVMINGYSFKGQGWSESELAELHDHGELKRFDRAVSDSLRDALIYGGAVAYPMLKADTPISYPQTVSELVSAGILVKDCIQRFIETDRWNTVMVPNWDVTAEDYMNPRSYYVPIGGVKVSTERSAMVRPNMLPFWGAIRQLGWGVSDFEGYYRSLSNYEIMVMTLPIIFQQMSLLFQAIPLDAVLMQNGKESVEEIIKVNEERLREMSMLHPKAIGMAGELKVVERHYEALSELFTVSRQDVAAKSEIPESVIFHTQPTGFSDNDDDVLLKQSEAITRLQIGIASSFAPLARMLAISCFGPAVLPKLNSLEVSFKIPVVQTPAGRSEAGGKFADMVSKLVSTSEFPPDVAVDMTLLFFDDVKIPEEIMDRLRGIQETALPDGMSGLDAIDDVIEKARTLAGQDRPTLQLLDSVAGEMRKVAGS